jgi:hypothetical protein
MECSGCPCPSANTSKERHADERIGKSIRVLQTQSRKSRDRLGVYAPAQVTLNLATWIG